MFAVQNAQQQAQPLRHRCAPEMRVVEPSRQSQIVEAMQRAQLRGRDVLVGRAVGRKTHGFRHIGAVYDKLQAPAFVAKQKMLRPTG